MLSGAGEMEAGRAERGRPKPGREPLVEQHAQFSRHCWPRVVRDRAHVVAVQRRVSETTCRNTNVDSVASPDPRGHSSHVVSQSFLFEAKRKKPL